MTDPCFVLIASDVRDSIGWSLDAFEWSFLTRLVEMLAGIYL